GWESMAHKTSVNGVSIVRSPLSADHPRLGRRRGRMRTRASRRASPGRCEPSRDYTPFRPPRDNAPRTKARILRETPNRAALRLAYLRSLANAARVMDFEGTR